MAEQKGQLSPDGYWWWDGERWVSAISPDGRWRWDGQGWVVNEVQTRPLGAARYESTPDTRRLQLAVTGYQVLAALAAVIVTPLTFNNSINQALNNSSGLDPTFIHGFGSAMLGIGITVNLLYRGLVVTGTWLRWRWMYYAVMVLGALSVFSLITNSLALAGVAMYALPAWAALVNLALTLANVALAVWMFILWQRYRTAWATRAVPI